MNQFNTIHLGGRLTRDPEIKTVNDMKLALFTISVHREFGEGVDFINCKAWTLNADKIEQMKSGDFVDFKGELQNNNYTKTDGTKVYQYVVVVKEL